MSILLTGGSGLLGTHLREHLNCYAPSSQNFNIIDPYLWEGMLPADCKLIVHCAAYTDLVKAEIEKQKCYDLNVLGTRNIAKLGVPMLYISTEYVFDGEKGNYGEGDYPNPQNFYSFTKLLGEYESRRTHSVVVRCLFKPRPFEHDLACVDQYTTGDYVDVIAEEIAKAIIVFDKLPPTIHIGTSRKSTFELAKQTRKVAPTTRETIKSVRLPRDISLNTRQWRKIKDEAGLR